MKAIVDRALTEITDCTTCLVVRRTGGAIPWHPERDIWLDEAMAVASAECPLPKR